MKTTDSVMREYNKIMLEWIESQWKIESAHQAGEPYTRMKFEAEADKVNKKLETLISHSLAEARRGERERILTMAHNIRSELKEPGYISLTRLEELLTGDNPESEKV